MPGENVYDWSPIAANNGTADSAINWQEGMPRAAVNDSARSMQAAIAKQRNLLSGTIATAGTANAQTFNAGALVPFLTVPTGMRAMLKIGAGLTNTGATTLAMDSSGNIAVKNPNGSDLVAGQLVGGGYGEFIYNGTNWILMGINGTLPDTTIGGTLGVTGDTTIGGTLGVTGNTTIGGTLGVAGLLSTSGDISSGATVTGVFGHFGGTAPSAANTALSIGHFGAGTQYGISLRPATDNTTSIYFVSAYDVGIGSITNNFGVSTSYNTTCDGELKTGIEDLPPVGHLIDDLRPVKFKWKDNLEAGEFTGFIAQEAYRAAPQAVTPGTDQIPWMMDYSKLVPLLVAELKSLRKRIADLEQK